MEIAESPLFAAILGGDVEAVSSVLRDEPSAVHGRLHNGRTPLNTAVGLLGATAELTPAKVAEIVGLLIDSAADPNLAAPPLDETPLQVALRQFIVLREDDVAGGLAVVEKLLDARADPNRGDELGETPLFEAVCSGSVEACRLLLSHRASPMLRNIHGRSALDLATNDAVRGVLAAAPPASPPPRAGGGFFDFDDLDDKETTSLEEDELPPPPAAACEQRAPDASFDFSELPGSDEKFSDLRNQVPGAAVQGVAQKSALDAGATVEVVGLTSTPEHNGCLGILQEFNADRGRWMVQLRTGKTLLLKPANLRVSSWGPPAALSSDGFEPPGSGASVDEMREQGNTFFKAGKFADAKACYSAALARHASNSVLLSNRAAACLMLKEWESATQDAMDSVRQDPSNVKACERCARSLLLQNRLPEGMKFCQARMHGLTPAQREMREWQPFLTTAQRIAAHASILHQMEQILADSSNAQEESEAARIVHGVVDMERQLSETERSSPLGERLGFTKVRALLFPVPGASGQSQEARELWTKDALAEMERLLEDKPKWPDSHHWRARCFLRLGRRREARDSLKEAMSIAASMGGEHLITEDLLDSMTITETKKADGNAAFQRQDWAEASSAYDAAIDADVGRWDVELSAQLLCNRSNVRSKLGLVSAALEDVSAALAMTPNYAKALFRRALICMELERYSDALRDFEGVARVAPQFSGLAEWLPRARSWALRPPRKNYYALLGIDFDAAPAEIKKAYKAAALKWHPDKNQDNRERAEKMFKDILEAFEVLSDPQRRFEYGGCGADPQHQQQQASWMRGGFTGSSFPERGFPGRGYQSGGRPGDAFASSGFAGSWEAGKAKGFGRGSASKGFPGHFKRGAYR